MTYSHPSPSFAVPDEPDSDAASRLVMAAIQSSAFRTVALRRSSGSTKSQISRSIKGVASAQAHEVRKCVAFDAGEYPGTVAARDELRIGGSAVDRQRHAPRWNIGLDPFEFRPTVRDLCKSDPREVAPPIEARPKQRLGRVDRGAEDADLSHHGLTLGGTHIANRDIGLAMLEHGRAVLADELELNVRMFLREGGQMTRQEAGDEGLYDREANHGAAVRRIVREIVGEREPCGVHVLRTPDHDHPAGGRGEPTVDAVEQARLETLLEGDDPAADGRLMHAQDFGRRHHGLMLREHQHIAKIIPVDVFRVHAQPLGAVRDCGVFALHLNACKIAMQDCKQLNCQCSRNDPS